MGNINSAGFVMTVFTTSAMVFWVRYMAPCIVVRWVSVSLDEVSTLLDQGQPLPDRVQLGLSFAILNERFMTLRTDSHQAPGSFQQLCLFFAGVTCKLYVLWQDIDAFKREVELAIDGLQLAALIAAHNASAIVPPDTTTNTAAPDTAAPDTAAPMNDFAAPALPPPAAVA